MDPHYFMSTLSKQENVCGTTKKIKILKIDGRTIVHIIVEFIMNRIISNLNWEAKEMTLRYIFIFCFPVDVI